MAKNYITGEQSGQLLIQPATIDEAGTWILADNLTIDIPETVDPSTGIRTVQGVGTIDLIVRGGINLDGVLDTGILIESNNSHVTIGAGSNIFAANGMKSANSVAEVHFINAGNITSSHVGVTQDATVSYFVNKAGGSIAAAFTAVMSGPNNAGDSFNLVNRGDIMGDDFAIDVMDADANITNTGTIAGDVRLGSGDDRINTRFGDLNGKIISGFGDDVFVLKSNQTVIVEKEFAGIDTVRIGSNADLYDNVENLSLLGGGNFNATGNASANVITGNKGANQILGLEGNDTLNGGRGNDTLTGGLDADTFIFHRNSDVDTITDFADGEDHIQLKGWKTIDEYADFSGRISQVGADVVIKFGDGDKLILTNFEMSDLTADDFIF